MAGLPCGLKWGDRVGPELSLGGTAGSSIAAPKVTIFGAGGVGVPCVIPCESRRGAPKWGLLCKFWFQNGGHCGAVSGWQLAVS